MNFMFKWHETISHEWVQRTSEILFLPREHKIHIFELTCNVLFIIEKSEMTVFLMIFRRFPTTFRRFPKIFQNCSQGKTNVPEHFPRISEDVRRFPKIAEDFRGRPEDVSIIPNEFKYNLRNKLDISEIIDIFERISYLHMWGYCIDFMNLLPLGIPLTFIKT